MRVAAIHQPECFPWLGFVDKARQADVFILLDDVQFTKNYFQNRNKIRTAQGESWLTVPVVTEGRSRQLIKDVEISTVDKRWRAKHLASLRQNYGPARYGKDYLPFFESLYAKDQRLLADFNEEAIRWIFQRFGARCEVRRASEFSAPAGATERLVALCRAAGADVYLSGISGRDYMDEALFKSAGIDVRYQEFYHPVYEQRYEPFIPALSSLDLLFNHGPAAAEILAGEKSPRMKTLFL